MSCLHAWALPCFASVNLIQRCRACLFHAFSGDSFRGSINHTTGKFAHTIIQGLFKIIGQKTCHYTSKFSGCDRTRWSFVLSHFVPFQMARFSTNLSHFVPVQMARISTGLSGGTSGTYDVTGGGVVTSQYVAWPCGVGCDVCSLCKCHALKLLRYWMYANWRKQPVRYVSLSVP